MSGSVVCRLWMKSDGTVICTKGLDAVVEDACEILFTSTGWVATYCDSSMVTNEEAPDSGSK